jgi:hypothetical protein
MKTSVTEEMRQAGSDVASLMTSAHLCRCFAGLGGSLDWEKFEEEFSEKPNFDIAVAYARGEIDSVTGIYLAMERAKP